MTVGTRLSGPEASASRKDSGYEFADGNKESFRALAASMSFVGVCTMLLGVVACVFVAGTVYLGLAPYALATAALAGGCVATAWWMVSAGRSLSALVTTRGRDVDHLMDAVRHLRRLFGMARVVIVVVSVLLVIAAGLIVWCTLAPERAGGKCFGVGL